jgi:hypothetical protein
MNVLNASPSWPIERNPPHGCCDMRKSLRRFAGADMRIAGAEVRSA